MDPSVEWDDGCGVVVGWAVPAALVRPVVVEVSGVLVEDCRGVAFVGKQSGEVDHAGWGGIHGLAVRASRMASMGRRPCLRALTR